MLTSTVSVTSVGTRYESFCTVWIASKWLRCIFQLPEMSGRRDSAIALRTLPKGGEAGEVAELEQLEGRAAARGDVVDVVDEAELRQRGRRVTASHDGERLRVGDGLGDGTGAGGEALVLEHAHRAV